MSVYGDPVSSIQELGNLDESEMIEGYRDGFDNEPEPQGNRSKSYWHGWRNGMIDGGHLQKDASAAVLARLVLSKALPQLDG